MTDQNILAAARLINASERTVIFTGAGISTESGIPDFRSPGGIWSQYNSDDLTYQKFISSEKYRKIYWEYDLARYPAMKDAQPNDAHKAIAELEKAGRVSALITQNIDGLHQIAGNTRDGIFELHGTVREVTCLECHTRWDREEITDKMDRDGIEVPYCEHCGGPLKCATVAFGQSLPQDVLEQAFIHSRNCDLFITIGSSLVVQPASLLPVEAKRAGARTILINLSDTPYDRIMDIIIISKAGPAMKAITEALKELDER
ncbi:NAD-dependent deacetylase [Thermodesulfobacteriota bacterium]